MESLIRSAVETQYGAAFSMLRGCIDRADDASWVAVSAKYPFWQVGYHTLFITDLYLAPNEKAFLPPAFHRAGYNDLGPTPWGPPTPIVVDQPYARETLLAYLEEIRAKARQAVQGETDAVLSGPSGFSWLKFSRLELHLYNVRHIQHHVGQLVAVLRREHGKGTNWVISEPL